MDRITPETLLGPAWIAEFPGSPLLRAEELEAANIPAGVERLLCKTRNSQIREQEKSFREDYIGLDESGARWILERKIRLLGMDYLSVASRSQTGPMHRILHGKEG